MDQFNFKGFTPDEKVENKASRVYHKLVDASPEDTKLSALLEWDGERYHCSIEVGSNAWPVASNRPFWMLSTTGMQSRGKSFTEASVALLEPSRP